MSHQEELASEDRRHASRFLKDPQSEYAIVRCTSQEEVVAEVYDESLGGISVILDRAHVPDVGEELDIVYLGSHLRSTVRHCVPYTDDAWVVGFDCEITWHVASTIS